MEYNSAQSSKTMVYQVQQRNALTDSTTSEEYRVAVALKESIRHDDYDITHDDITPYAAWKAG
jgi:hypothetical protein